MFGWRKVRMNVMDKLKAENLEEDFKMPEVRNLSFAFCDWGLKWVLFSPKKSEMFFLQNWF